MKLIFSFLLVLFYTFINAQTLEETIDWLNTKKSDVISVESYHLPKNSTNTILFSFTKIRIDNSNGGYTSIGFDTINDFRISETNESPALYIVSSYIHEGLPLYIKMNFPTIELRDRFKKAFSHIVNLKGNEMVTSLSSEKKDMLEWLNSRSIDIFEGENKLRLLYDDVGIKKYFLKSTDSILINWSKIKSISYNVYGENKKYYVFNVKSSDSITGNSEVIKFYVYSGVAESYGEILKDLAISNGAQLINEDLF